MFLSALRRSADWLVALAAGVLAAIYYLPFVHPGVGPVRFLDALQYQTNAAVLGVTHPPSHPLYIFLTRLFALLPLQVLDRLPGFGWYAPFGDNIAYRVNLFSALASIAAVVVMVRLVHLLTHNRLIAFCTGMLLAGAIGFWVQATYAELYPFYNLLIATSFALLIHWMQTRRIGYYYASAFVYALAYGVNTPALLLLPAWLWGVIATDPRLLRTPRHFFVTAGLVLLAASQFLYVPLRVFWLGPPPFCNLCPETPGDLAGFLTGKHWRDLGIGFGVEPRFWLQRWADSGYQMMLSFWPFGIALAAIGGWHLLHRRRTIGVMLLLGLAATWFLVVTYEVPDWADFMTPVYIFLTPLIGAGMHAVWSAAQPPPDRPLTVPRRGGLVVLALVPVLFAAAVYANNRPIVAGFLNDNGSMINHWAARDLLTRMEPNARLIIGPVGSNGFNQGWAIRYVSWAEGLRPELQAIWPPIREAPPGPPPGYVRWEDAVATLADAPVYAIELDDPRLAGYALLPILRDDGWPVGYRLVGHQTDAGPEIWLPAAEWEVVEEQIIWK